MKRSSRPRKTAELSESVHRQISSYVLAAGAAGVGMLGLAHPAEAKIIYTPTHTQIAPNNTVPLDLNHDGKTDFSIHDSFTCTSFCEYIEGAITVIPALQRNEVVGYPGRSQHYAFALSAGVRVGPKSPFLQGDEVMAFGGYDAGTNTVGSCFGPWKNAKKRFLGFKFTIAGKLHYGWARLNETCAKNGENTAILNGYAYETIPNKAIITGKTKGPDVVTVQPATLGHLAVGAAAIPAWRTSELVTPNH
ncbi:MAG TPA: hypothetical protein VNZ03_36375 [Terriglobales bacterium]|jgi:hypothetical protein|nr:hypothetical protein [Terriglobales bacterium]